MERWRDISDYPNYQVSDRGRVRSKQRITIDINGRAMRFNSVIRKQHVGNSKRLAVTLRSGGARSTSDSKLVHHLVLEAFVGPRPHGMEACHNDGNCFHNALANLRWDNREGNVADVYRHGVRQRDRLSMLPRLHGRSFASAYLSGVSALV